MSIKQAIPPAMMIVGGLNLLVGHLGSIELRITGAFIALAGLVLWATFRVLDSLKRLEREQHQAQQWQEVERILARPIPQRPRHAPRDRSHLSVVKALIVGIPSSLLAWALARARDNAVPMTLAASMVAATPLMAPVLHRPPETPASDAGMTPDDLQPVVDVEPETVSHTPTPEPTSERKTSPERAPETEPTTDQPTGAVSTSEPTATPTSSTPSPEPTPTSTPEPEPEPEPTGGAPTEPPGRDNQDESERGDGPTQRPDRAGEPGPPTEPPGQDKKSEESGDLDRGNGGGQGDRRGNRGGVSGVGSKVAVDVDGGLDALVPESSLYDWQWHAGSDQPRRM